MTEEDDVFLKIMNQKRDPAVDPCTEDTFEEVMNFFEETAQLKQPYASVDNPPVLSYAEMEDTMDATLEDPMKPWAKQIYEHWKSRRMAVQNNPLVAQLKVCYLVSNWLCETANIAFRSLKLDKTPMTVIHLSVSVDARFARSARRVVEMRKVPKSSDAFAKSWKMLASLLLWCASARSLARRCSPWSASSSSSVLRSRR
jgi:hypothetical protein